MNCPACSADMRKASRRGVTIDVCPQCRGVWLDRGEIENLLRASASATHAEPNPDDLIRDLFSPK